MVCRLYLITPENLPDPQLFAANLQGVLAAGDVACLQVRLKNASREDVAAAVQAIHPVTEAADVALLLNDDPALAVETSCDGVHIGRKDGTYASARTAVGPGGIVGVTCHSSRHDAMVAAEAGADYVAFGSFFPSATKPDAEPADPEILEIWAEIATVPSVAIGGITSENCVPLIKAGADFLAVNTGVWSHPRGPEAAVAEFTALMAEHSPAP